MNEVLKDVETIALGLSSIYPIAWSIPAVIMVSIMSFGTFKHIISLAQQLA